MCSWLLLSISSVGLCSVFALPSAISNCQLLCLCNWAACLSASIACAKWACYRMICEDGEDVFTSACTFHKHYPNLTFGQQWTLLKVPGAVSKWVVCPGWEVRNQTERTWCDDSLWLSLHDPRCLFRDFLKWKKSFFPSPHEFIHLRSKMKVLCYCKLFFPVEQLQ